MLYVLHCTWFEAFVNFKETDKVIERMETIAQKCPDNLAINVLLTKAYIKNSLMREGFAFVFLEYPELR